MTSLRATLLLLSFIPVIATTVAEPPPATRISPTTDSIQGAQVTENYRWLEDQNAPEVKAWTAAQNKYSRAFLDALPDRAAIESRLTEIYSQVSPSYGGLVSRPGRTFALKFQPPKQQRLLVALTSLDDLGSAKTVLDPNELEPRGKVAMDWFVPSPDGKTVAVCLSSGGSEEGALHFYDASTGAALPDIVSRVQCPTAGGSAAWAPDGRSIFYTRYPHPGEKPAEDLRFYQQIYLHQLGSPETEDTYSLGRDFPKIAEVKLENSRDGQWLLAAVADGDGGKFEHYVRALGKSGGGVWRQIASFDDEIKHAEFACDNSALYLRSVKNAPRGRILRLPLHLGSSLASAEEVVPQSDTVIQAFAATPSFLYVADLAGGPSRFRRFDLHGGQPLELPIPEASGVSGLTSMQESPDDERILFQQTSYVSSPAWYLCRSDAGKTAPEIRKTALVDDSPVKYDDIEVVREFATSKDGTRIPINILRRKGAKLDGNNPTLLYGYGGYSISMTPRFSVERRLWFDRGGVYAIANLRGGGEFGEAWHLAGNLLHKQNVFDDFAACAQHLIDRGYTRPEKLALEGGSNGGLLMGALLTQHPELARAVVSHVGIYDMLRVELDANGAFNVTEFGTVKDPAQFKVLYGYSPYHHVTDGTKYPAVFLLTGENDGRVDPAHSRKMAARLQSATSSGLPVLLRVSSGAGHGMGTALSERISQQADVLAFLFDQLGMTALHP